jgi:hypothetical protein
MDDPVGKNIGGLGAIPDLKISLRSFRNGGN